MNATPQGQAIPGLLDQLGTNGALCAFNFESYETLVPALRASGETGIPVVVEITVPAAQAFGYEYVVELVSLAARRHGAKYALHLDHCEDHRELRTAVMAGFNSANYLNEGALTDEDYLRVATKLRSDLPADVSLEFVLGELGHSDHDNHTDHRPPTADAILAFADACKPDILGYDMGSLHGMRSRTQALDVSLIRTVADGSGLPAVLHGSSGVKDADLLEAISAGVRKVNVESLLRRTFIDAVRERVDGDGPASRKPRILVSEVDQVMTELMRTMMLSYSAPQIPNA